MSARMVYLTKSEMFIAFSLAGMRNGQNKNNNAKPRYGASENESEAIDIYSCRGEMAVAKYLNLFWSGSLGDYKAVDVGGLVEVRTVNKKGRRLIVHPEDRDWAPYVLVDASDAPNMLLIGWMYGADAKNKDYWSDPTGMGRHAFFVPQDDLRYMDELKSLVSLNQITIPDNP